MRNKPFIYKLLLVLFLIEPLIKVLYFKAITHFDFSLILENLASRTGPREIFDFWLVFPLAALTLIKIRKWSYFVFLSLMAYIVFSIFTYEEYTWPYNSNTPFFYNYAIVGLAVIVFILFLLPEVREPFFNSKVRWWERKPRYKANLPCQLRDGTNAFTSEILDISQTGALLKVSDDLQIGREFRIDFEAGDQKVVNVPIKVVSRLSYNNQEGFGIQYFPENKAQKKQISQVIKAVKNRPKL